MRSSRTACVVALASLVAISAFAQGRPQQPGPPSEPSTTTQTVVDSTGKLVGPVLSAAPNLSSAAIKYALPSGDFIAMNVNANHIFTTAAPEGNNADSAQVYFTSSDCSGPAYVFQHSNAALTKRQGLILYMLEPPTPQPWTGTCIPQEQVDAWLYVTDPLACWTFIPEQSPMTFFSYYGYDFEDPMETGETLCQPYPTGYSLPNPQHEDSFGDTYKIYRRVENLSTKFAPPFYIP
jgi:hypothetical protein